MNAPLSPLIWGDSQDPLALLGDELARFVRQHFARVGCLEVFYLIIRLLDTKGGGHWTPDVLAAMLGQSVGQTKGHLEALAKSGLLTRTRGPAYALAADPGQRRLLQALSQRMRDDYRARLAVTAFVMANEVDYLREELAARRLVERAKGRLMQQHGISEDQAQRLLLKMSRDGRCSLRATAQAVLENSPP